MSKRTRAAAATLSVSLLVLGACGNGDDTNGGDAGNGGEASPTAPAEPGDEGDSDASENEAGGQENAAGAAAQCGEVDGPLIAANAEPGEPTLEIPDLDGWERVTDMDSEMIRLSMADMSRADGGFPPSVVVTAEESSSDVDRDFEAQVTAVEQAMGASDVDSSEGETCGYRSLTVDYMAPEMGGMPERPITSEVIVVEEGEQAIVYTVTMQAADPDDEQFAEDKRKIFEGIQISD